MKNILVTGGAGYIGSHMVHALKEAGYHPVVLDNLSTGRKSLVLDAELVVADIADKITLNALFKTYKFSAVMHFAGFIRVGESVEEPAKYYQNNLAYSLNLLDVMLDHKVKNLIFSSSAAVYGDPEYTPIDTKHPKNPINPYGQSKWMFEQILSDYDKAYDLKSVSLRYFNAAGADPLGRLGEWHDPETHLIPLVLQVASGRLDDIKIFGKDYPTKDGTCIRDYIHICDLCQAHLLALEALLKGGDSAAYNLGNGNGYSVLEVIEAAEKVTGKKIKVQFSPRRAGDPAVLVADAKEAEKKLGWKPKFADLKTIISHAWAWEQKLMTCRGVA
ncbi:MAG: UDP-glucose 4-epimerase GalE [Gammaproteobacteria bacterium]